MLCLQQFHQNQRLIAISFICIKGNLFIAFSIRTEMFGGIDPKKMQTMMRQMGIKQEEVEVERVILEGSDKRIIIEPASVMKIAMQGQTSWQVTGEAREEEKDIGIHEEDIEMVVGKTGKGKEEARKALEECGGDIAEAIVKLSE